ncbi:MAG: hypothetical protein BWX88_01089 [Planctomycetes bacterium ADurb.Bin126]|nr:MAG: hypothetical protein BWX88_01089 [Planctomycetes bacterium ADurb.Bin126]HOD80426.1 hypothetical protein [Phycisphaerae bacterium]HQL72740.1 hypothetical protein [Phycisphaerae bacterium]
MVQSIGNLRAAALPIAVALLTVASCRGAAAELPANKWTQIDQEKSGNRIGARVVWLEKEKKLVVSGGLDGKSYREPKRPDRMVFDLARREWSPYAGEPALPEPPAILVLKDRSGRLTLSVELPEELRAQAGERTPENSPLEGESSIFPAGLTGHLCFLDPVNREVHLVGGSAPGFKEGHIGNWVYSLAHNRWGRSEAGTAAGRALRGELQTLHLAQKDLVAAARNVFYSGLPAEREAAAVRSVLAAAQTDLAKRVETVAEKRRIEGERAGIAADSLQVAMCLCAGAYEGASAASRGWSSGTLNAALIAQAESASWRLDEAADALAAEPTPRRDASGLYDPHHRQYVLFGGDHGDYLLGDTWIYDCSKRAWRRMWPKVSPPGRCDVQTFYLPAAKKIAFVAGTTYPTKMIYQRLSQKIPPEVWLYDPAANEWTFLVRPGEEATKKSRDGLPLLVTNNPMVLVDGDVLLCPAVGGNNYHSYMVSSTWMLRLDASKADPVLTAEFNVTGVARLYRSQRAAAYDPQWYDAAPRGDPAATEKLIAQMPVNQWIAVPQSPRPCPERSWGTSVYDPEGDQVLVWSGGHCADPADIVHHYHPGVNRWSIPYVAGGGVRGNQLTGRPDCFNHTYHNFAYDPVSRRMIAAHRSGTHVYDPARRDWTDFTCEQLFPYNLYSAKCASTPRGVVAWAGAVSGGPARVHFQLFDAATLKWTPLAVQGKVPSDVHGDEAGLCWDPQRKRLYLFAARAYQKADGRVHRYDFETGRMDVLDPAGREAIGDQFWKYRETLYLPQVELILFGMGWVEGRQVAYDPVRNRWLLTVLERTSRAAAYDAGSGRWTFAPPKKDDKVGSVTFSPVLDTRRNVLWAPSDYKAMYVLKIDPKTFVEPDHRP